MTYARTYGTDDDSSKEFRRVQVRADNQVSDSAYREAPRREANRRLSMKKIMVMAADIKVVTEEAQGPYKDPVERGQGEAVRR